MHDPKQYEAILTDSAEFDMASDRMTGQWLRAIAASKENGRFLEIGTGTGLSACWVLDGMDAGSTLLTLDNSAERTAVARKYLAHDSRVTFIIEDAAQTMRALAANGHKFDFIFADAWPGKYQDLDLALSLVDEYGCYLVDDLLPQENWPAGHAAKARQLVDYLSSQESLASVMLDASTGLMMCTRTAD